MECNRTVSLRLLRYCSSALADEHAPEETGVEREEILQHVAGVRAVEHFDARAAAETRSRDDVGVAVAVDVRRGHRYSARDRAGGGKVQEHVGGIRAVENLHLRAAGSDEVGMAGAADVAARHEDTPRKGPGE